MPERILKNSSYLNAKSTTGTITRVKDVSPTSGMCPICIRDCPFLCEIGLSSFRGREALYPEPLQSGYSTAGALKDFHLDWSDLAALTEWASKVTGIPLISEVDMDMFEAVLS
mgnify:CR=1 FL=1